MSEERRVVSETEGAYQPITFPDLVRTEEDTEFLVKAINDRMEKMFQSMGIKAELLEGHLRFASGKIAALEQELSDLKFKLGNLEYLLAHRS